MKDSSPRPDWYCPGLGLAVPANSSIHKRKLLLAPQNKIILRHLNKRADELSNDAIKDYINISDDDIKNIYKA